MTDHSRDRYKPQPADGQRQTSHDRSNGMAPTITDISSRRRLSTPKASPLPKRTPSQKSSKVSSYQTSAASSTSTPVQKPGWFMSLDRLPRKKSTVSDRTADVNKWASSTATQKRMNGGGSSSTSRTRSPAASTLKPALRFFGDTDAESVDAASISKATGKQYRPAHAKMFNGSAHLSRSTHNLDAPVSGKPSMSNGKLRSTSMQQLPQPPTIHEENTVSSGSPRTRPSSRYCRLIKLYVFCCFVCYRQHHYNHRSKYPLHDISPSTSENEQTTAVRISRGLCEPRLKQRRQYHSTDQLQSSRHQPPNGDAYHPPLRENYERHSRSEMRKPPPGPQKPARSVDRRRAFSM